MLPARKNRSKLSFISLLILLTAFCIAAYFLATSPSQVPLRLNLNGEPVMGSKWRVLVVPLIMLFISLLLRSAETTGQINAPAGLDSQQRRKMAAGLHVFSLGTLLLAFMAMLR